MAPFRLPGKRGPDPEQLARARRPMTRLEERREVLRAKFTELQWDLGGAAYEMAARDYFRLDVLATMAAKLQTVDAELAEIERLARLEQAGAAGACPGCGSLHAQGAVYCWRCGRNLTLPAGSQALVAGTPSVVPNGTAPDAAVLPEMNGDPAGVDRDLSAVDRAPAGVDREFAELDAELAELDADFAELDTDLGEGSGHEGRGDEGRGQPGGG
jgi:hypothetical protein